MKRSKNILDLNRRNFLNVIGKAGLSAGFLNASTFATGMMLGRAAEAQTGNIRRVVCVYIPDGAPIDGTNMWLPSDNLVMAPTTEPLNSVKDECVFFKNALISDADGGPCGGHGNTSKAFGAQGYRNSYDVLLERTIGVNSPFPSLLFGVQSNGHGSATKKDNSEVVYQDSPNAMFNRIFGSSVNINPIGIQRSQSILDIHREELAALKNVLGSAELTRLDEHLTSVEKIKNRLDQQAQNELDPACTNPAWNLDGFEYSAENKTRFTKEANLQVDTAVLALKCNLTNVASIMFGNHQSEHAIPELSYTADYHQSIHGGNVETYTITRAYLSERLAYLIEALKNTTDDMGEPLINSTLVLQSTDMGDGNAHGSTDAPIMLAGGGSTIRRGQVVTLDRHTNMFDIATEALGLSGVIENLGTGPVTGVIA